MTVPSMLMQIWKRISDIGEHTERSAREIRCLRICNQIAWIIACLVALYAPLYWLLGHSYVALFNLVVGLLLVSIIPLNRSRHFPLLGRQFFLLINNLAIFCYCILLGRESWAQLFFLNMVMVPYLVFTSKYRLLLLSWSLVPGLLFIALEAHGFQLLASFTIVKPELQRQIFWLLSPTAFAIVLLYANYLYGIINRHEAALLKRIGELQKSQQTIQEQQVHLAAATHFGAIAELSASVSHEINNPLAIIRGYAEQLEILMRREALDLIRVKLIADRIKQTVDRITRITSSLRKLSREGSNDPFEEVDLIRIIEDVLAVNREALRRDGIELRLELGERPAPCICRHVQIAQVLLNLIQNAKDAVVELAEKWICIRLENKDDGYELTIIDSGRGIPPHIVPHIFQPFFTTKPLGKGSGFGLNLARKIVNAHHGQLFVDTKAEHTTFIMRLPKDGRWMRSQVLTVEA